MATMEAVEALEGVRWALEIFPQRFVSRRKALGAGPRLYATAYWRANYAECTRHQQAAEFHSG